MGKRRLNSMPLLALVNDTSETDQASDRLSPCFNALIGNVHVHAGAQRVRADSSGPFTVYTFIVSSPDSKTWWVLKKRYSQFHTLRKLLLQLRTSPLASFVAPLAALPFPKKHLRADLDTVVAERRLRLQDFTAALVSLRTDCLIACKGPVDQRAEKYRVVYELLHAFLEVPKLHEEAEARARAQSAKTDGTDPCSICMTDESVEVTVFQLPCGHSFHERCIVRWLELKQTCPLCRYEAYEGYPRVHIRAVNVLAPSSDKHTGSDAFTVFVLVAACPSTKSWWMLHKRYSQFYALRKQLQRLERKMTGGLLTRVIGAPFPRKHVLLTIDNPVVIQERKRLLQNFTAELIALRATCLASNKTAMESQLPVMAQIGRLVSEFLQAPPMGAAAPPTASCCSICLEEAETTSTEGKDMTLVMPCGHSFHEPCLVKWFESDSSCPLCRARAVHGTIA
ncbi:hypothetical protein ACHHYP_03827 [Achlya hypogyna]|uniref:RING-type domain-containing protein n=1 Tax=Achlya hypogyna TaxID=1202772 RepID=A0A1V9Z358_ACHHY|nr:hypothetical protein ACHHYP_03827 [Achlya hypogyna]